MSEKEATARIKINRLLEAAGWRCFPQGDGPANIRLEPLEEFRYRLEAHIHPAVSDGGAYVCD